MYALIKEGVIERYPYTITDLRRDNPRTSFPKNPNNISLLEFGVNKIFTTNKPQVNSDQIAVESLPVFDGKQWNQTWVIRNKTSEELLIEESIAREKRNTLLIESDWTQLEDSPVDKNKWALYRQHLREITSQSGFPHNIEWPQKP